MRNWEKGNPPFSQKLKKFEENTDSGISKYAGLRSQ